MYIICGLVFITNESGTLGENKVWIPDGLFKALLVRSNGRYEAIGFFMSNKSQKKDIKHYIKSVNDLEKMVHMDFFPSLSDSAEEMVEETVNRKVWGL